MGTSDFLGKEILSVDVRWELSIWTDYCTAVLPFIAEKQILITLSASPSRSNLDPFNQYSEEQIWVALERTHMKECVSIMVSMGYLFVFWLSKLCILLVANPETLL